MKVVGISGSPRRHGNTELLLDEIMKGAASAGAEVNTIVLNKLKITPCQHCDACYKAGKCRIKDDMQDIYRELESADRIVLASPIQFLGPTAQLKAMVDRCQALWARKYILKKPPLKDRRERKGFLVSVGALKMADLFQPTIAMVKALFSVLDITYEGELLFRGVDEKGAIANYPDVLQQAYLAGQKLAKP